MISSVGSEPRDEVPEADWVEQQAATESDPYGVRSSGTHSTSTHSTSTEADTVDLADQDLEVVLDDEEG